MRQRFLILLGALLFAASTAGCVLAVGVEADDKRHDMHPEKNAGKLKAHATLDAKSGSALTGMATFTQVDLGVIVELKLHDTPPGRHAVHIHEIGDCSSEDGKSAGGHFNPGASEHGAPSAAMHHAGDLGNIWVNTDGSGHHVILMPELTVDPGPFSVVGRAIIVHAGADDLTTQPTGNAGGRIGCGEIR